MPEVSEIGRRLWCAIALAGGAGLSLPAAAGTIRVPQDQPTIQAAIDAAAAGDTVLVSPGVYTGPGNRNLDTRSKAITVKSAGGAATCVLDAEGISRSEYQAVFVIQGSETPATVIEGFTIRGGYHFNGGGVSVLSGSPTFRDCVITGNHVDCWGGGVYVQSSGSPRFINCRVAGNSSAAEGGGIFMIGSGVSRIEGCVIEGNTANVGAGICTFSGQPLFVNCRITANSAGWGGGAGYMSGGKLINCTVAGNSAASYGSAVYGGSSTQITNTIVWGNTGAAPLEGTVTTTYSIVQGGAPGVGNRSGNPLFVDPAAGDYTVARGSPAIDAGANPSVPAGVVVDLTGAPRFVNDPATVDSGMGLGAIVDIGAYEHGRKKFVKLAP